MTNKYTKIFDSSKCIPQELLKQYITHNIDSEHKHIIEKHIIDCEMCNDELEGLQALHNRNLEPIINKLDSEIDYIADLKQKSVFLDFRFLAIASSFLILVFVSTFYFNGNFIKKSKNEISQQLQSEKNQPSRKIIIAENSIKKDEPIEKDIAFNDFESKTVAEEKSIEQPELKSKQTIDSNDEVLNIQSNLKSPDFIAKGESIKDIRENEEKSKINDFSTNELFSLSSSSLDISHSDLESLQKTDKSAENIENQDKIKIIETLSSKTAKRESSAKASQMPVAQQQQTTDSKKSTPNIKSNYELGYELYKSNNYNSAIEYFEKISTKTDDVNYHRAQWFLAQCYVKTQNNSKAKKVLNQIIKADNSYKIQAEELLKTLN